MNKSQKDVELEAMRPGNCLDMRNKGEGRLKDASQFLGGWIIRGWFGDFIRIVNA